ncbi:Terminase RNaseH-like domain containing protein [uncultured Caudovirales phage]|uniref:Terminase RNaseH-like domain containing protein n=1 Tax=uncultured Caudovirales phage TaxID=2100421 RepID=A0A6J5N4F0_9CAUD|nr:Terminase RNaseH-like domain containing protein [uncultured Caudovirales phage]
MLTNEEKVLKIMCETNLLFFTRYIYKENTRRNFIVAPHFIKIANTLEEVAKGNIKRLIINIPPRYGKTELAVKCFIAWSLAKNPQSKFIHLSYSDSLALDNSSQTKEYIESDAFQKFWEMKLKKDAQSKSKWFNDFGGGVYATASGGAITGFGAGVTESKEFSGAIIIDDPLKPDDALSEIKRKAVNERFNNTIRSRVNDRETPIIVIMQRLHENDMSGFLLAGGSGEEWHHLCLPALNNKNEPLWEDKHTFAELEQIRQANRYNFSGQYMQTPSPEEGGEWRKDWFEIINRNDVPNVEWDMFIDGAYTKDTKNDPTGIQIGAKIGQNYFILSSIDKYLEMPELIKFIPEHIEALGIKVRMIYVEPKASGKSIAQLIQSTTSLNITELKSNFVSVSKIERARSASPYIEGGRVKLVKGNWNEHFLHQIAVFPNGKHDEHIDLTAYGIENKLIEKQFFTF